VVVAALLVVVLVAATVLTFSVIRRPLPQVTGSVDLPGLGAEVSVTRDARGVPHITADTSADLFRAQGYVHAQDRFFEMDYRRHVTAGRLSELVGENADALAADKVIRTLGWRRVAEQELPLLAPATRDALQAYADGVNAYLGQRDASSLAVEYTILGLQVDVAHPEPWSPVDSLAWLKAMAWDLRGNYDEELSRALTFSVVHDVQRVDELFPAYPQDLHSPILDAASVQRPVATTTSSVLDLADTRVRRCGTRGRSAPARLGRRHRLQLVGRQRPVHRVRQAAPRQRPAPVDLGAGHLGAGRAELPRGHRCLPLRRRGLLVRRPARSVHRAQRPARMGPDEPRRGRDRLRAREGRRRMVAARRRAGAADDADRDDQGQRWGRRQAGGALDEPRPPGLRRPRGRGRRHRPDA
jgi:hypothetical protein